jgi:hypothetical protein
VWLRGRNGPLWRSCAGRADTPSPAAVDAIEAAIGYELLNELPDSMETYVEMG